MAEGRKWRAAVVHHGCGQSGRLSASPPPRQTTHRCFLVWVLRLLVSHTPPPLEHPLRTQSLGNTSQACAAAHQVRIRCFGLSGVWPDQIATTQSAACSQMRKRGATRLSGRRDFGRHYGLYMAQCAQRKQHDTTHTPNVFKSPRTTRATALCKRTLREGKRQNKNVIR